MTEKSKQIYPHLAPAMLGSVWQQVLPNAQHQSPGGWLEEHG